jgi:hypothetical protein
MPLKVAFAHELGVAHVTQLSHDGLGLLSAAGILALQDRD